MNERRVMFVILLGTLIAYPVAAILAEIFSQTLELWREHRERTRR
jgi:hypothetical protein